MILHHTMASCLVVPANLFVRDSAAYHEFVLLLQAAAAVEKAAQQYSFTLDTSRRPDLIRMRLTALAVLASGVWARGLRFVWLGSELLHLSWSRQRHRLAAAFAVSLLFLRLFDVLLLIDASVKVVKFCGLASSKLKVDDGGAADAARLRMRRIVAAGLFSGLVTVALAMTGFALLLQLR